MWLLSQMMRDREMPWRCLLCRLVKTPSLSHQNLRREKEQFNFSSCTITFIVLHSQLVLPVPVSQCSELSRQQAGQERSDSTSGQSGLRDGPHPHIDVMRRPVQELEFVS